MAVKFIIDYSSHSDHRKSWWWYWDWTGSLNPPPKLEKPASAKEWWQWRLGKMQLWLLECIHTHPSFFEIWIVAGSLHSSWGEQVASRTILNQHASTRECIQSLTSANRLEYTIFNDSIPSHSCWFTRLVCFWINPPLGFRWTFLSGHCRVLFFTGGLFVIHWRSLLTHTWLARSTVGKIGSSGHFSADKGGWRRERWRFSSASTSLYRHCPPSD